MLRQTQLQSISFGLVEEMETKINYKGTQEPAGVREYHAPSLHEGGIAAVARGCGRSNVAHLRI